MRSLVDENLPQTSLKRCAKLGTTLPGFADTDFGELVFRSRRAAGSGVILLRLRGSPSEHLEALMAALATRDDWSGQFAVVTRDRLRVTPLQQDG